MAASSIGQQVVRALTRARIAILTVALTYALSVLAGAVMVHAGNGFALAQRDNLVERAQSGSTLVALQSGDRLRAALLDFGGNLFLGAVPNTVAGIFSYPIAAYRGWVGGIVSVDGAHASRLANPGEAAYYLLTLFLQLLPYSLAGGAGVNFSIAYLRAQSLDKRERWHGLPKQALYDVLRIYLLVVPLFLVASLWEFLAR